ncbi:hypothetical protein [Caldifermentibacillus hisashii]|uniref:hypothetical protein n=1 Tax=Caldifermentibacillus hisashii TaxID=996558 RepID=UPI000BA2F5D3|nr:hypothetical protein [Caldifermentibacillus hisashii]PAC36903.1 hypothetical protein CEJ87_04665 [Caldifermentibacillus hisashii]
MDEENKNQIKIKINGEDKEFKEELIIHDWKTKREVAATEERAIPLLKNKKKKKTCTPKRKEPSGYHYFFHLRHCNRNLNWNYLITIYDKRRKWKRTRLSNGSSEQWYNNSR